jgi:hypothetical protein
MTQLHASLEQYRDQLHAAIERDRTARRGPRSRLAPRLAISAAATVAVGAVLVGALGGETSTPSADAAVLRHVAAALAPQSGTILYERAMVSVGGSSAQLYELWQTTQAPYTYRVIKWGHEGAGTATAVNDPASELRTLVQSGHATVLATTFDGVPAYKLTVTGANDKWVNGTAYVAQGDYRPLEIDTTGGGGEVIRYQAYAHLPATAANLRLLHM